MFQNMNIILLLKFLTHTPWLQIFLDVLNFNMYFIWKEICLGVFKPLNHNYIQIPYIL